MMSLKIYFTEPWFGCSFNFDGNNRFVGYSAYCLRYLNLVSRKINRLQQCLCQINPSTDYLGRNSQREGSIGAVPYRATATETIGYFTGHSQHVNALHIFKCQK